MAFSSLIGWDFSVASSHWLGYFSGLLSLVGMFHWPSIIGWDISVASSHWLGYVSGLLSLVGMFHYPLFTGLPLGITGSTADENLGQLHSGPSVDTEGKVFITYSLGSICKVIILSLPPAQWAQCGHGGEGLHHLQTGLHLQGDYRWLILTTTAKPRTFSSELKNSQKSVRLLMLKLSVFFC